MRRLVVALVVVAVGLAGCGSDRARPKASPSPTPTVPAKLDTTAPTRPDQEADTAQSAVAYATYFARLVQYSVRVRDAGPVYGETYDQALCSSCTSLSSYIEKVKESDTWEIGEDLQIGHLASSLGKDGPQVAGPSVYPQSVFVDLHGKATDAPVKAKRSRLVVWLRWDGAASRWRVRDYAF